MIRFPSLCLPALICLSFQAYAHQSDGTGTYSQGNDTIVYFEDLSDLLNINIYTLVKSNSVTIRFEDEKLILRPNSPVSLGFGVNYKGLGIALGLGLPHTQERNDKFGKTSRLDVQMNLNTRWLMGTGYLQIYQGYYHANPGDFTEWGKPNYPTLQEMRTVSLGASAFYVFNHKKFSPKAALSRTQLQKHSAGSLALGLYGSYNEASSPDGFIPKEFADSIATDLDIQSYKFYSIGVMFGYMYTWVFAKRFFLHGSVIPGIGYKNVQMNFTQEGGGTEHKPDGQVFLRAAFGCELKCVYLGVTASTLIRNVKYKDYDIDMSTDSFRFFVGKRFDVTRKKSRKP
jgi:hypothetical protein